MFLFTQVRFDLALIAG